MSWQGAVNCTLLLVKYGTCTNYGPKSTLCDTSVEFILDMHWCTWTRKLALAMGIDLHLEGIPTEHSTVEFAQLFEPTWVRFPESTTCKIKWDWFSSHLQEFAQVHLQCLQGRFHLIHTFVYERRVMASVFSYLAVPYLDLESDLKSTEVNGVNWCKACVREVDLGSVTSLE